MIQPLVTNSVHSVMVSCLVSVNDFGSISVLSNRGDLLSSVSRICTLSLLVSLSGVVVLSLVNRVVKKVVSCGLKVKLLVFIQSKNRSVVSDKWVGSA